MEDIFNVFIFDDEQENDDIEDAVILDVLRDGNLGNRAAIYGRFHFENLENVQCLSMFRFKKEHIPRLARALGIPDVVNVNRVQFTGTEALCILLRRLAYPNRLVDLESIFRYCNSLISLVSNAVLNLINENKGHLLTSLRNVPYFNREKLIQFSRAIQEMGCPLENCFGFIDGTARAVCRPAVNQREYYSGHKKVHCVKYQSLITPDGIIINLSDAFPGRRHDAGILRDSGLLQQLQQVVVFPDRTFRLYGDEGYGLHNLLIRPFSIHEINQNPERQEFNNRMKVLRVAVEWGFGKVCNEFAFVDFKKNQKLLVQDIESIYKVAVLLANCHTCLYGSEVGEYFNFNSPELEVYLA